MIVHQRIGRSANRRGGWIAGFFLTLAAILVLATPSFAQAPRRDVRDRSGRSSAEPANAPVGRYK